jgi:hypothetical protein
MRMLFRLIALTCVAVVGLSAGPAHAAVGKTPEQSQTSTSSRHPELSGKRLRAPGSDAVYVIDQNGYRRGIPNAETYDSLFRDWESVEENDIVEEITSRPDLSKGAFLGREPGTSGVYLFTDKVRFGIASAATMDKYGFDWNKVRDTPDFVFGYVQELGTWR